MALTIEQTLERGVAAQEQGKLQEAERIYRSILQSSPLHPDANHKLGLLAVSVGNNAAALPFFKTALEANPNIEQIWLCYIKALISEKKLSTAKKVLKNAQENGISGENIDVLMSFVVFPRFFKMAGKGGIAVSG